MQKNPECAMSFTSAVVNNLKTNTEKYRNKYKINKKFTFKKVLFLGGGFYPSSSLVYKTKLMQNNIKFIITIFIKLLIFINIPLQLTRQNSFVKLQQHLL